MWILLGIIAFIAIVYVTTYNGIIGSKNNIKEAQGSVDSVLQNRYDLIPNLVEVVKKYASHEASVLENVTKLRSSLINGNESGAEKFGHENQLTGALKSVFALSENYPDLKANENFISLQNQWTEIEDRLQAARRTYNAALEDFLNKTEMFPGSIIAGTMNLPKYEMFKAETEAQSAPKAKDLF